MRGHRLGRQLLATAGGPAEQIHRGAGTTGESPGSDVTIWVRQAASCRGAGTSGASPGSSRLYIREDNNILCFDMYNNRYLILYYYATMAQLNPEVIIFLIPRIAWYYESDYGLS